MFKLRKKMENSGWVSEEVERHVSSERGESQQMFASFGN